MDEQNENVEDMNIVTEEMLTELSNGKEEDE